VSISTAKVSPPIAQSRRNAELDSLGADQREQSFISNPMLAVLMLVAAEMMLFSGLIGSFIIFKMQAPFWPPPALPHLPLAVTWVNTVVLLASAGTMSLAVRAVHRDRARELRRWLGVTGVLGATFLAVQGSEWLRLVAHGLRLTSGIYGGTFYTLIGCHALHVTAAVIWLLFVAGAAMRGRFSARNPGGVEICAVYWYFVCAIWPLLFVLVYLWKD
jgi:cytochrome c oxidase subunit III